MAKLNKPVKWHVFQHGYLLWVRSDDDLSRMDDEFKAAFQPVKLGFNTKTEAWTFAQSLSGFGGPVGRGRC